ncbi:MAG: phage holin family protein [Christensenellales bacterium]
MFKAVIRYLFGTLAFPLADYLLFGLWCRDLQSALLVGACLMLLYALLRPLARLVSIAFNLLTLGLFGIVIDTLLILLTVRLLPELVRVQSAQWAVLAALIINLVRFIGGKLVRN